MKLRNSLLMLVGLGTTAGMANATTWGEAEVDDPIVDGARCAIQVPASYGSYIYYWPEKFDQVFWPMTDPMGIGYCHRSGMVAFLGDLENLGTEEKSRLSAWLAEREHPDTGRPDAAWLLDRLGELTELRGFDTRGRLLRLRALAVLNEGRENFTAATELRRQVLAGIRAELASGQLDDERTLEYLFVAANYARYLGDAEAADADLERLSGLIEKTDAAELKNYADYLASLIPGSRLITGDTGSRMAGEAVLKASEPRWK